MCDDRINEVAQRLTEQLPAAEFRANVLARIEAPRHRGGWTPFFAAITAAATAVLVSVTLVGLRTSRVTPATAPLYPTTPVASTASPEQRVAPRMMDSPNGQREPALSPPRYQPSPQFEREHEPFAGGDRIALEPIELARLTAAEPVSMDPISTDLLIVAALEIAPLDRQPLEY